MPISKAQAYWLLDNMDVLNDLADQFKLAQFKQWTSQRSDDELREIHAKAQGADSFRSFIEYKLLEIVRVENE